MAIKSFAGEAQEAKRFLSTTNKTYHATWQVLRRVMMRDIFASSTTGGLGVMSLLVAVFGGTIFKADTCQLIPL